MNPSPLIRRFPTRLAIALVAVTAFDQIGAQAEEPGTSLTVADHHIIPRYERLAESTGGLSDQAEAFCTGLDADALERLRSGFHEAMDDWQGIQHIRFGPVEFLFRYSRYELWPDKRGSVGKHLERLLAAADSEALEPGPFAEGSVAVQGFSALERLLFGDEAVPPAAFSGEPAGRYRCDLVRAIARNLATMSSALRDDWSKGEQSHRNFFATAAAGNAFYEDGRDIDSRLLNDMTTQLEFMAFYKLGLPLGDGIDKARGKRAESWRSARELRNLNLNLVALHHLYAQAFSPRVADTDPDREIIHAFEQAFATLAAVEQPLAVAVEDPEQRLRVKQLMDEIEAIKQGVTGPLAAALGLEIGFNSLDGD